MAEPERPRKACCRRAVEGRGDEHAQLENAGIGDLDADLGGADGGIEHRTDVADAAGQRLVGIGVELDLRGLAELMFGMSFSYTSQTIHTTERSAMVNAVAVPE